MTYCPSQDWDRFINEQDEAAAAETAFYTAHQQQIIEVTCALIAAGRLNIKQPDAADVVGLIDEASNIVRTIAYRGQEGME